eukprot:TRINITY_DN7845_c0_g4_i1.p1 TRINITY_DN7845_c0_g4~~TRINITY_DN7845_c0_g4_i1.p1  ORF type:complete len:491 (-),score=66.12 TRINITY_DN7845_c0_g4_i1:103-1575(-)
MSFFNIEGPNSEYASSNSLTSEPCDFSTLPLTLVTNDNFDLHAPSSPRVTDLFRHFGALAFAEESCPSALLSDKLSSQYCSEEYRQTTIIRLPGVKYKASLGAISIYFILVKAFIGIGVMYMPGYFNQMGYMVCIQLMLIITLLTAYGLSKLLQCYTKYRVNYSIITGMALSKPFQHFVSLLLFVGPLMYGIIYMNYCINTVMASIACFTYYDSPVVSKLLAALLLIALISPLLCIKNWRNYSIIFISSSLLLIVILFSFSIPVGLYTKEPDFPAYKKFSLVEIVSFIGTYSFSLEGFGMNIAFYQRTSTKGLYNKIFCFAMGTVCFLQILFGLLLSTVGDEGKPPMPILDPKVLTELLRLPASYSFCLCSVYLFCVIPGYYLAMLPALRRVERVLKHFFGEDGRKGKVRKAACVSLGIVTVVLGALIGSGTTIAIVMGYTICIPLAIIMPAMVHFTLIAETILEKILDVGLLAIGSAAIVLAISSLVLQ